MPPAYSYDYLVEKNNNRKQTYTFTCASIFMRTITDYSVTWPSTEFRLFQIMLNLKSSPNFQTALWEW